MRIKHEMLKKLRLERGWRQIDAAEAARIDERTYRRYESGQVNSGPSSTSFSKQFEILRDLAAVFELNGPEDLIDASGDAAGEVVSSSAPQPPDAPYDEAWYVMRGVEERRALNRLRGPGAPVVLQGPQFYGKSTMLSHLLVQLERAGGRTIRINIASLDKSHFASFDSFLRELSRRILRQTPLQDTEAILEESWQRPGSEMTKIAWILEQRLLSQGPLRLAFEKADALHGLSYQDDFFAMLRGWSERSTKDPWQNLRLVVTVSTEPTMLESIDHSSFFVLANPIRLEDLTAEHIVKMAQRYGLETPPPNLASCILSVVGGSPYLIRLALYESIIQQCPIEQVLDSKSDGSTSIFGQHLMRLRSWLQSEGLLAALYKILEDPSHEPPFDVYCKLYSRGILVEEAAGAYRLRNQLYEHYFGKLLRKRA